MLDFGYYNKDCMEGMREFPDGYFDLAIVDPPYGDGGVPSRARKDSDSDSTDTANRVSRKELLSRNRPRRELSLTSQIVGGVPETPYERTQKRPASAGLVEHGRRSSEKNYFVGRCAGTGIL